MNTLGTTAMREHRAVHELSQIETEQISGGKGCDAGDRTQWVHKQGDPSWLYHDCCGGAHNIHNP